MDIICVFLQRGMMQQRTVSDEDVEKAYKIMATIVRNHGDKYLPVFKRLHDEMETRKAKRDLKNIALQIAADIP